MVLGGWQVFGQEEKEGKERWKKEEEMIKLNLN